MGDNTMRYLQSKPLKIADKFFNFDKDALPLYPNEFLNQFTKYEPERDEKNEKHRVYSIHLYQSHYNPEMYELCRDYEINVHSRAVKDSSKHFFKNFMAYSPLYD